MFWFLLFSFVIDGTPTPANTPQNTPLLSSEVVTALITFATTLTGGIIAWLRERGKRKDAERRSAEAERKQQHSEELAQSAAKAVQNSMLERFGFKVTSASFFADIIDMDGTSKMEWKWNGVRITRQSARLFHIPGMVWYSTPRAKITEYPVLTKKIFSRDVKLAHLTRTDKECQFQIEISGGLAYEDPELSYEYRAEAFASFLMSREEVEATFEPFKKEFFSIDVVTPLDRVDLEVTFPEGFLVDTYPGVFMGTVLSDGLMHGEELRRIEDGFIKTSRGAKFTIAEPLIGFRYLIYWVPLSQRVVDALKQSKVSSSGSGKEAQNV